MCALNMHTQQHGGCCGTFSNPLWGVRACCSPSILQSNAVAADPLQWRKVRGQNLTLELLQLPKHE